MPNNEALIRTLSAAVRIQLQGYDVGEVLDALTEDAADVVGMVGAGLALGGEGGHLQFVTASDERVARLEEWQEAHQEGPCQDAYRKRRRTIVDRLDAEGGWGEFPAAALEATIRSVASFPMVTNDACLGVLTLYGDEPRGWHVGLIDAAQLLADLASLYIINQRRIQASETLASHLQYALDSRLVVEQAKGVIAGRKGIDLAVAFRRLRRHSRNTNTGIHTVARLVVEGRLDL